MSYSPIVPAIIPNSKEMVIEQAKKLNFSKEIHLDVVDGKFVEAVSWPYEPLGEPLSVKSYLDTYTLEVDLMVNEPIRAATEWIVAGADMLVFHMETLPLEVFKNFTNGTDVSIGISAHGDFDIDEFSKYCEYADYIQIMGIKKIGAQGQPFADSVLEIISEIKIRFPYKSITVDGSVNQFTIKKIKAAGADRFICGSAIVGESNPQVAHTTLGALING
jgi:ribulose-phosphate 3-epimerase